MTELQSYKPAPVHFFIHIPKCGGTTFSDYLSRHFPLERIYTATKSIRVWENYRRERAAAQAQSADLSSLAPLEQRHVDEMKKHDLIVENHFSWRDAELLKRHRAVMTYAVFRDPREQVASHFLHLQRIPTQTAHELAPESRNQYQLAKELSITDWCALAWDRSEIWASVFNLQTRMISSYPVNRHLYKQMDPEAFFEDAVNNLESIDFVADLRELEEFTRLISLNNGWLPPGEQVSLNEGSPDSSLAKTLADQVPEELVSLDLRLLDLVSLRYRAWKRKVLDDLSITQWRRDCRSSIAFKSKRDWEVDFSGPVFGTNFHGREGEPPEVHRWLGPSRQSLLFLPAHRGSTAIISLYIVAMITPEMLSGTRFQLDGVDVSPRFSNDENCIVATLTVNAEQVTDDAVALVITTPMTTSERDTGIGTDTRQKSLALRRVRVSIEV